MKKTFKREGIVVEKVKTFNVNNKLDLDAEKYEVLEISYIKMDSTMEEKVIKMENSEGEIINRINKRKYFTKVSPIEGLIKTKNISEERYQIYKRESKLTEQCVRTTYLQDNPNIEIITERYDKGRTELHVIYLEDIKEIEYKDILDKEL